MARETLFLLDGTALAYRAYFALLRGGKPSTGRPGGFTTQQGTPTGAVYGFITTVRKLLADHHPNYAGIAFDTAAPTLRHEAFADYKANRKPMPEDLVAQLPYIFRAAEALRIPLIVRDGYEADDIIGTFAKRAVAAGLDVVLVTLDKDMYQLLGPQVSMLQLRSETRHLRAEDVVGEFGVGPEQVIDVLALWGDPTDNIPGVAGIGEKGAKALLAAWGSLEGVYAHLDQIKPALAAKLSAGESQARLSRELATIHTDLDLPFDLEALRVEAPDREKLHALATELEFRGLARESAPAASVTAPAHRKLPDAAALEDWLAGARAAGRIAIELLATSKEPMRARVLGLGLAAPGLESAYLPLAGEDDGIVARLAAELSPGVVAVTANNLKFARIWLEGRGSAVARPAPGADTPIEALDLDTALLAYLLDPGRPAQALEALCSELGIERPADAPALDPAEVASGTESEALAAAVAGRAAAALALGAALVQRIRATPLATLYRDIELPLVPVLAAMERTGVRLDGDRLQALSAEMAARLETLGQRIHGLAGTEFNINSPRQLGEILFEKMNLPVLKKTRKAKSASTDTEVLEELARDYELPRLVLEHRELTKLKGTYIDPLPRLVHPATGRLHTSYHQTVAATGRLSSSDPNLQNIPIRTETGKRIRAAFVTDPGWLLVSADYSQIELRLLGHLSGDPELVRAFKDGADVHTRTAATMLGIPEPLITAELRRRAKAMNFGIIYGMSAFGLARELRIAQSEASRLINEYFARYAGVRSWLDSTIASARESGRVETLFGRVRLLPEIRSDNRSTREYAERTATNTPIQGTAADLIKLAMIKVARRLASDRLEARLILQVHDELVLECPERECAAVSVLVRDEMEGVASLAVPLEVSVGSGPNWLEAK